MMTESPWTRKYWELIARHEIMLQKRKDGEFDTQEWLELIEDMEVHGMLAMANDIKRDMPNHEMHAKFWKLLSKADRWSGGGRLKANGEFEELTGNDLNMRNEIER
jgi:hypothetical protein